MEQDSWVELTDQTGREVVLKYPPQRVISLVPSLTELLCALGLEDRLVGVTKFCTAPAHIRKGKMVVGGTKSIHPGRIEALHADLVLCNKEENTLEIVELLKRNCAVHVSDIVGLDDVFELIGQYGRLFGIPEKASQLSTRIRNSRALFAAGGVRPRVKVAYFIWKDPWMLAGGETFINGMLREGGFENVAARTARYPVLGDSWPEAWELPDLVFLSSEPYPFRNAHKDALRELIPDAKMVLVDGSYFSWYGSRLTTAFTYIGELRQQLGLDA